MICKIWIALNLLGKFYYHVSKQHSTISMYSAMSNQLTYLLIPISISIGYTGMR